MPKTIIIIDDDPEDLEVLKDVLADVDPGLQCISFTSPEEAIRFIGDDTQLRPDFIIIDINMPRMNGHECLKVLRAIPSLDQVPIVIYSTTIPEDVADSLKRDGASLLFEKPRKQIEYRRIVEQILSLSYLPGIL